MEKETALKTLRELHSKALFSERTALETLIPELAEPEDERIRKELIGFLKSPFVNKNLTDKKVAPWISWLEKQHKQHLELKAGHWYICHRAYCCRSDHLTVREGERFMCEEDGVVKGFVIKDPEKYFKEVCAPASIEKGEKPVDKVESKFKAGDWCIYNEGNTIFQITKVLYNLYYYKTNEGKEYSCTRDSIEHDAHLWTIEDAKDGDVLYCESNGVKYIVMSKNPNKHGAIDSYFRYNSLYGFGVDIYSVLDAEHDFITPANEKQRDFLFKKMEEEGYEWDALNKELKIIE